MPGRFELKPTLAKIWHAPDHFRILDPLPPMHRRGLILAFLLVVIGFLLPTPKETVTPPTSVGREAQLNIQSQSQPQTQSQPSQPLVTSPPVQNQQPAPVLNEEPQAVQEPIQQERPVAEHSAPATSSAGGIEQQWRTYRVEQGKTLAQVFRDHNLPPTDVYAMAKVEGEGKPLSTLQSGQMVKIRQNANGVVTGLTIENGSGQSVLFVRQQDGSFIRAR
jgi:cell envelope opacity-associated protein A